MDRRTHFLDNHLAGLQPEGGFWVGPSPGPLPVMLPRNSACSTLLCFVPPFYVLSLWTYFVSV